MGVGGIHAFDTLQNADLNLDCELLDNSCNRAWATIFTLSPDAFMFLWGPLFLGLLVVAVHKTKKLGTQRPKNNLVIAIFANLGYAGLFGLGTGFLSFISAFLYMICYAV